MLQTDTRKKVLLCITKSIVGGAQKYISDIATRLPSDAFETVVIAGGSGPLFGLLRTKGIRTIAIPVLERDINPLQELQALFYLIAIFIREKPDIIHLNSSKMGAMGAMAAWISKLLTLNVKPRVIFTVHGWGFHEDRTHIQRAAIFATSVVSSFFHHHTIVINSADYKDAITFIAPKHLSLIPLGIEISNSLSRQESRAFFSSIVGRTFDDSTRIIGTIAELTKNKGLSYLVDALHHLLVLSKKFNIHCVIMGEGEERKRLEEQIENLHLGYYISLFGFVPDAHRYLPGLDLFILTSVKEGLPYALMEAMNAGLPVIATQVGGIPDLISHKKNGICIAPKNPHAIKEQLEYVLSSHDQLGNLGAHAQQTIATHYSLETMIKKTVQLYHELTPSH